jgi:hypothetical protein
MSIVDESIEEYNTVEISRSYDVIVVGGGIAGTASALAAARMGCSTLLIEKSVMLGGLATLGNIAIYLPLCDGRGHKLIGGIAEELLHLSIEYGYDSLPDEWRSGWTRVQTNKRYSTVYSPPEFVLALDEVIVKQGIEVLFDTLFCRPVMDRRVCKAIVTENKSGRRAYAAKRFIDCSGDADLAFRAGSDCIETDNWLSYWLYSTDLESMREAVRDNLVRRAIHLEQLGADNAGRGAPARASKYRGTDGRQVTEFILEGRKMAREKLVRIGKTTYSYLSLPGMAQFRTTRRIRGRYTLIGEDVSRSFPDSIGCVGDWRKPGPVYEIPYRCLSGDEIENMLVAGRCIAADGEAWEVCRVIPPAAMTGQAAGTAAVLSLQRDCSVQEVDIQQLQERLVETGVLLHPPEPV